VPNTDHPTAAPDFSLKVVRRDVSLEDRYVAGRGTVLLSGIQALVRVTLEQRRRDAERGLDTGLFVSGYQGSPLGGLDLEFGRARRHVESSGVVFRPGLNEELAATAVAGTQALEQLPGHRHQGVTGIWYGKNPGFDRAADAIRHGNISGTSPYGGAVAWVGDDPASKSSSVPSSCEPMCRSLMVPVLAPGTVQDILRLGLHAIELSRHAGLWTALKVVTDVADATHSVDLEDALHGLPAPQPRSGFVPPVMLPPTNLDAEEDLMGARLARALQYARLAELNAVTVDSRRPRLVLLAAGLAHQAVVRALDDLGISVDAADELGIRVVRLSMPWPLDRQQVREFCDGVETVLVVEDKLAFVETLVRDALYGTPRPPAVVGKEDLEGRPLLPARSFVSGDDVALAIGRLLGAEGLSERAQARLGSLAPSPAPRTDAESVDPRRTPYFCSGCPHNTSTAADPNQLVGVGIGCHTMVMLDDGARRGKLTGVTQMGGEGAQWIGMSPFTDDEHLVQNLGDGTFHHSGSLAIRATVAAGVNITYKLLYNDTVAMTGGQRPEGKLEVPEITHLLAAEGVAATIVTTPEPDRYEGVALAGNATVRHRDDLPAVQAELQARGGVTVIIHDDQCATEKRRLRKRGDLPVPKERVWINERVCEGCGDCGDQATCLSLLPVPTEYGRKTRIQQSSCNLDTTCLKGDCPSFLMVTVPDTAVARPPVPVPPLVPEPVLRVPTEVLVRMPGVGGTGVVTVSAILQMGAHLDGLHAAGLEQIGLAQKGGPVISDVRIGPAPIEGQLRASVASVDVLLGFDLLGAVTAETLAAADRATTVAVLNTSVLPTAAMVTDVRAAGASVRRATRRVAAVTRAGENFEVAAIEIAETLFGDHLPANMVLLGAAFQHGCLPVSAAALNEAIRLNGALVDANLAAFGWGRAAVAAPDALEAALAAAAPPAPRAYEAPEDLRSRVASLGLPEPVAALVSARAAELIAYQDRRYASRYLDDVESVAVLERDAGTGVEAPVTRAVAAGLFKLMAYKDEYEVARLHLDAYERQRVADAYGEKAKVRVLLHPPLLRALGVDRKISLGRSAFATFDVLHRARRLRGTPLDPFGRAKVRRVERGLPSEYLQAVRQAMGHLTPDRVQRVIEVAELPDVVRGYEEIKLANVVTFRARVAELLDRLERSAAAA